MSQIIAANAFKVVEGRPVTSSRIVAEYFGKQHHHVVRDIRTLISQKPDLEPKLPGMHLVPEHPRGQGQT